jgi:putative sigma-54 modulation protein
LDIEITGRHVNVKPDVESYAREKGEKVAKFLKRQGRVEIVLDHERDNFLVEVIVSGYRGPVLVSHVQHPDARAAIDLAVDKTEQQLRKLKGRRKDHRGPSMAGDDAPGSGDDGSASGDADPSYDDVIDEELNH